MPDVKKALDAMLDAFNQILLERCDADPNLYRIDEPLYFPDEIAELFRSYGSGAEIVISNPHRQERYTFSGSYDRDLTLRVYDAIEAGDEVKINGDVIANPW